MKVLVISDSHGNIANLEHVLGFAKRVNAGAIIHCGDWDNLLAVETVVSSGIDVYAVLGNADIDPAISEKLKVQSEKFSEKFLEVEIDGRKIGVVHQLTINNQPLTIGCDIIFCGHTHTQGESAFGGIKVVNPGAMENKISFAVYDTKTNKVDLVKI